MPVNEGTSVPSIETFNWRGQTRYKCPLFWESGAKCEFDSDSQEAVKQHIARTAHTYTGKAVISSATENVEITPEEVKPEYKEIKFAKEEREAGE